MKQSLKRLVSMFLALGFLIASFVLFFDVIQPAYNGVQTLRGQLAGETQALNAETTAVDQALTQISAYKEGSAGQASVSLAVPNGEDLAGALAQVEGIAQNDSVSVTSIGISPPALSQQTTASGGSTKATTSPLGSFSFDVAGSASYENFKIFLEQLATNIRIFDVKSLTFTPAPTVAVAAPMGKNSVATPAANPDLFNYNLTIQTYYQVP